MNERMKSMDKLTQLGEDIIAKITAGEFPKLEIPARGTGNITFDTHAGQYVLGDSKAVRDSSNLRHVKSFAQLLWSACFSKDLLKTSRTSSLRDLFYSSEAFGIKFRDQAESNRIIADLECLTGIAREDLGIYPEEHSSVYGEITMRYTVPKYEGREIDLTLCPDGLPIGPALMTAEPVDAKAQIILAVESGGMFSRLIETDAWKRFNALLVHLGGQPPRSTRRLMRKIRDTLGLPIYIFTDGDPWGLHIARVIIAGSANAAHVRELTVSDAEWIGVTPADIAKHNLPTESMNNADLKRLDELAQDKRYDDSLLQGYIEEFRQLKRKAEQQAFSRHGMDYVVDVYLPEKLP